MNTQRPTPSEYVDFYETYVSKVPDGDVIETLSRGPVLTSRLLKDGSEDLADRRYAAGKWSIREVVAHMTDTERLFCGRALHFARRDPAPLPGMDQEVWARSADAEHRSLAEHLREFGAVRAANVAFFAGLSDDAWQRVGVASDCSFTVRSLAWIMAGHEIHHRTILEERYLA